MYVNIISKGREQKAKDCSRNAQKSEYVRDAIREESKEYRKH
jgi:hypothetical protein